MDMWKAPFLELDTVEVSNNLSKAFSLDKIIQGLTFGLFEAFVCLALSILSVSDETDILRLEVESSLGISGSSSAISMLIPMISESSR